MRVREAWFLHRPLPRGDAASVSTAPLPDRSVLDLYVVGFENDGVLRRQSEALSTHLEDPYSLTVLDNSPSEGGRRRIREACSISGTDYVRVPRNPATGSDPSRSHGLALNWGYRHLMRPRAPRWLGVLDPDVYPERSTSVIRYLKQQPCFGHKQARDGRWYLWPGFTFFDMDRVEGLDFLPVPGLDTGGANWEFVFKDLDPSTLTFPAHSYAEASGSTRGRIERFGDWVHTFNSSAWQ